MTTDCAGVDTYLVSETEKEPTIRKVTDRLGVRFPDAPKTVIAGIVTEEYDSLGGARIRIYVATLIENSARNRLRREFGTVSTTD